jgi:hypothetical protein
MKKKLLLFIGGCFILSGVCWYSLKDNFCESNLERELKNLDFKVKEEKKDSLEYSPRAINSESKRDGTYCFNYSTSPITILK